jgi:hypothetical protein
MLANCQQNKSQLGYQKSLQVTFDNVLALLKLNAVSKE